MSSDSGPNNVSYNDLFVFGYASGFQPHVARRKDTVMKNERRNASRFVQLFVVAVLLFMAAPRLLAQSSSSSSGSGRSDGKINLNFRNNPATNFNPPPCDFQDFFYNNVGISTSSQGNTPVTAQGVDSVPAQRFGLFRQTGPPAIFPSQVNWVVDNTCTTRDTVRKNIRILATTAGYVDDGNGSPTVFISIIAFLTNQSFFETSFTSNPDITSHPNLNTGPNTPFPFDCSVLPIPPALPIPGCVVITNGDAQVTSTDGSAGAANDEPVGFGLNARANSPSPLGGAGSGPLGSAQGDAMQDIVSNFEAYPALKQRLPNGTFAPIPCGSLDNSSNDPDAVFFAATGTHSPAIPSDNPPTKVCFPVNSIATPSLRQDWRFATNRNAIDGSDNNSVNSSGGTFGDVTRIGFNSPYGYFCDDLLGMWINTYFWFTQDPGVNGPCSSVYASIGATNGFSLDGTPIVKTANELNNLLEAAGCAQEGKIDFSGNDGGAVWLICPAIADPTNGGIALDAFIDQVRQPSGFPLDPRFTLNFLCLQFFGQFCSNLTPSQVNSAQSQGAAAASAAASAPAASTN
jgi:hypothetical protein